MTNPNQIVRLHSRNGGRASVYETNQWAQPYESGILSGTGVTAGTGLNVNVNGSQSNPTVLIAKNPAGYKIALDLVSQATLTLTSPVSNSGITAIVAYTDDLATGSTDTTVTGNPSSCGLLAVSGTASANPEAPDDATIRAAITTDGATGSQAVYTIIALVTLTSGTTDITDTLIQNKSAIPAPEPEPEVNPTKYGWRKMTVTGDTLTLPANVKYARIKALVRSTQASEGDASYINLGNYTGAVYDRRISMANDFICEEFENMDGRISTLRGSVTGDVSQYTHYWIDLAFPEATGTTTTVFGKMTFHSTNSFYSAIETFEYEVNNKTQIHTYQMYKRNASITNCKWFVEYLTREDVEEFEEEL